MNSPPTPARGVHLEVLPLRDVDRPVVRHRAQQQVPAGVSQGNLVEDRVILGAFDEIEDLRRHPAVGFVLVLQERQRVVGCLHHAPHVLFERARQTAVLAVDALDFGIAVRRLAVQHVEPGRGHPRPLPKEAISTPLGMRRWKEESDDTNARSMY